MAMASWIKMSLARPFDTGNHTENRFKRADGDKSGLLDKSEVSEFHQSLISGGEENEEDDSKRKKKKRKK